jgi:ethanolamine transporter
MLGLIPVPIGAFLAGVLAGYSPTFIGQQLIPVLIFTAIVIGGLILIEDFMIRVSFLSHLRVSKTPHLKT